MLNWGLSTELAFLQAPTSGFVRIKVGVVDDENCSNFCKQKFFSTSHSSVRSHHVYEKSMGLLYVAKCTWRMNPVFSWTKNKLSFCCKRHKSKSFGRKPCFWVTSPNGEQSYALEESEEAARELPPCIGSKVQLLHQIAWRELPPCIGSKD